MQIHIHGVCQTDDDRQRRIIDAILDLADIGLIDPASDRKLLLGHLARVSGCQQSSQNLTVM